MATQARVLVLGTIRPEGIAILREFADVVSLPEPVSKQEILERIRDVDGILHKVGRIDADVLAAQTRLRVIARHGVGLDDLDLDAIRARGIALSTTVGANTNAVVEATLALTLAVLRHLPQADAMLRHDRRWVRESLMGRELSSLTCGVVGFGRIGRRVAQALAGFDSPVLVHDPAPESTRDCPYAVLPLSDLLDRSDVVSLHCPLTPQTRHLIDADRLARMKTDAILINTSRGGLIDTDALAAALLGKRIGGAGLDVFEREPPDFAHPLFRLPNVVVTPHVAAMTLEAQTTMATAAAREVFRVLREGLPPQHSVF